MEHPAPVVLVKLSPPAMPVFIGGLLGVGVANGVTRRQSRLPGVTAFAQQLERAGALPRRPGESRSPSRELLPAAAPDGTGSEGVGVE